MSNLKVFHILIPFITLGVLLLFLLQGHNAAGTPLFDPRAYIERGDQVEKRYDAYSKRLAKHYAALMAAMREHAPDLLGHLHRAKRYHTGTKSCRPYRYRRARLKAPPSAGGLQWQTARLIENELRKWNIAKWIPPRLDVTSTKRRTHGKAGRYYGRRAAAAKNPCPCAIQSAYASGHCRESPGYDRETALLATLSRVENIDV